MRLVRVWIAEVKSILVGNMVRSGTVLYGTLLRTMHTLVLRKSTANCHQKPFAYKGDDSSDTYPYSYALPFQIIRKRAVQLIQYNHIYSTAQYLPLV